jgi:hypothetical protein
MSTELADLGLNTPRDFPPPVRPPRPQNQLPREYWPIERNLQPGFYQEHDREHGYHWINKPRKSGHLSARIYPNVRNGTIFVSVFDESPANRNNPEGAVSIKRWSVELRMTGNWQRRLADHAGRATVQAKKQPKCPRCNEALVLLHAKAGNQFFGCPKYPECTGSLSIGEFEAERRRPAAAADTQAAK